MTDVINDISVYRSAKIGTGKNKERKTTRKGKEESSKLKSVHETNNTTCKTRYM